MTKLSDLSGQEMFSLRQEIKQEQSGDMTPERIEEIKRDAQEEAETIYRNCTSNISNIEILGLLAALEEAQQQKVELWECEDCGFAFDAIHENDTPEGGYSCPLCAESRLEKELAEAQQTIARQREALEPEQRKSIIDHCSDLNRYDDDNFSAPICIDDLPEEDKAEVMEWLYVLLGSCAESAVDSVTDLLAAFEGGKTQL